MEEILKEKPDHIKKTNQLNLAFLGTGWIGRNRMEAICKSGYAQAGKILDPDEDNCREALNSASGAVKVNSYNEILEDEDIDGVVIATPSALHAKQSYEALENNKAVFCQKPLGRTAEEAREVVKLAEEKDLLLGVDLSYRYTKAMQKVYDILQTGELGDIFSIDLVFHNAYGPDKDWFYDPERAGGGCVIDLGVHLVDLALWGLGFPEVENVHSRLYSNGKRIHLSENEVEDYATVILDLETGAAVDLACSWNLQAGQEAEIKAIFYGTKGAVAFKNINGSFYDFVVERYHGTEKETLITPPDDWMGRAGAVWAEKAAAGETYSKEAEEFIRVAEVLDKIYDR